MKNRPGEKIKLASIDELLGVVNEESAMEIEINKIHAFKNHPFKVLDDEKMQDLIESVKLSGVLTPVLLRVDNNDEYEMISGHRRLHAAKMAGLTTIPAIVRELSDDDAVIAMVDANIQREELLSDFPVDLHQSITLFCLLLPVQFLNLRLWWSCRLRLSGL